jgi:tRNA(Ile2) C34 agmatinyltransferase TiaS
MELSRNLEARFRSAYVEGIKPSAPHQFDGMDKWFCPGCGQRLTKGGDGVARCPKCERAMGEFAYEIIEFNPHM